MGDVKCTDAHGPYIVKIMGGLGNQMFQYAFGLALGKAFGVKVLYDIFWFDEMKQAGWDNATVRCYGLDAFVANVEFASHEQIALCYNQTRVRVSWLPGELRKLFRRPKYRYLAPKILERQQNVYDESLLAPRCKGYYEGYFQTERYFADLKDQLCVDFTLKHPLGGDGKKILKLIHSVNAVSLHVRRGDYVQLSEIYGVCSLSYYQKAIAYIVSHVQEPHFFLFSDDVEWVQQHMKLDAPYTIVDVSDAQSDYCDLELMKNCQHHIIANSSFSWWGAWLNPNPHKIVICPHPWLAAGTPTDIVCKNWLQIEG